MHRFRRRRVSLEPALGLKRKWIWEICLVVMDRVGTYTEESALRDGMPIDNQGLAVVRVL